MKKFMDIMLAIVLIIICAVLIYWFITYDGNSPTAPENPSGEYSEMQSTENPAETAGGNNGDVQYTYYKVTVSEDRYFTADGEFTLEELIGKISALGEDYAVEIIDDNATLKAYEKLTGRLDEISVPYTEDGGMQ